jgi:hypothetical protein
MFIPHTTHNTQIGKKKKKIEERNEVLLWWLLSDPVGF